jgi:cytochrome c oxidase cbb3-type subunit 1
MIFSLILLAPSWGGMINGIMTLSGAWHKLRDDPILKFLIVSRCRSTACRPSKVR